MKRGKVKLFFLFIIIIGLIILATIPVFRLITGTGKIHKLEVGMKDHEVIQIFGEPDSRTPVPGKGTRNGS